jgi:tetratricopeptide (TPR) repeat protein
MILIVILLSLLSTNLLAQDIGIKIAILPFENKTGLDEYDYLSQSISKSVYASVNQQTGIDLIDNSEAEKAAKKVGLKIENMDKVSTTLRFALEAEINVIIMGEYSLDNDNDLLKVDAYVYSIAQKKVIINLNFESELGSSMFELVDEISYTTSKELKERKDEIQIALEEIRKNLQPPEYVKEPEITEVTIDGVKVEWETTKETVSTLYVSEDEDFTIDTDTPYFEDQSEDAINHYVIIDYETIDPEKEYYFKSVDEDFFQNSVTHDEKKIPEKEIYNTLISQYESEVQELYDQMEKYKEENDFDAALEIYNKIIEYNDKYEKVIEKVGDSEEVEEKTKNDYKTASEVMKILEQADEYQQKEDYQAALDEYEKAYNMILDNDLTELINVEPIEKEINRMKAVLKVIELVKKGDKDFNNENMREAKKAYEESLKIIKKNGIDDIIDPDPIKQKLNSINEDLLPPMNYINAGSGVFINPEIMESISDIVPMWQFSYNFRFNRLFSMGVGFNLFSLVVDTKFSFINTFSDELLFEFGIQSSFLPSLPMGVGAIANIKYIHRFGTLGFYTSIGAWASYYWPQEIPNHQITEPVLVYYPYLTLGLILHL